MRLRSHSESASTRNSSTSTPKALSKQTSRHSRQRVVGGKHVYVRVELDEKSAGVLALNDEEFARFPARW